MPSLKFNGKLDDLKNRVAAIESGGNWSDGGNGNHQYRNAGGAVMNWSPSTGTIWFQGDPGARSVLEGAVTQLLRSQPPGPMAPPIESPTVPRERNIFIVCGHDEASRDQLDLALRKLGLETFILGNSTGEGKTIIEALENKIGRDFTSDFGIVLFTPDDVGYARKDGSTKAQSRARQNVVLETGMLLASLTRSRMAILVKGDVDMPSDLQGIIQLRFKDHVREIVPKLAKRLTEAKIPVDSNRIADATA